MEELINFLNKKDQSYEDLKRDSISKEKENHKLQQEIADMRLRYSRHLSMKDDEIQTEKRRNEKAISAQIKAKEENDNLTETVLTNQALINKLQQQVKVRINLKPLSQF